MALFISFISPFFTHPSQNIPQSDPSHGTNFPKKKLSQKQRKAIKRQQSAPLERTNHRAKRFHSTAWTVDPERVTGEIISWNQRSNFGFIKTEDDESEILLYGRDFADIPEEYSTTASQNGRRPKQKKSNWTGFLVEFEMRFENQARAVNARILTGKEARAIRGIEESEDESEDEKDRWSDGQDNAPSREQITNESPSSEDDESSPKRKSNGGCGKWHTARSRRALARTAEMDLKEWKSPRIKVNDYDDAEIVKKRHNGYKPRLQRERERIQKLKQKSKAKRKVLVPPRIGTTAVRPSGGGIPMAAAPAPNKWIAPPKDTHFAGFYRMFERVVTTSPQSQNRQSISVVLQKIYNKVIVSEDLKKYIKKGSAPSNMNECPVCFTDMSPNFQSDDSDCKSDDSSTSLAPLFNCGHTALCYDCLQHYVSLKIKDEDGVLPWISCPAEKCRAPIHFGDLISRSSCSVTTSNLYKLCTIILSKQLSRSPHFVACSGVAKDESLSENKESMASTSSSCTFGFFCQDQNGTSKRKSCKLCGLVQDVKPKRPDEYFDDGFKAMLRTGMLRLCPVCTHPAMKDYGMCNVMECGQCGIFWNWNSKVTGSTYAQVKENGRQYGTLWEAGELGYQLDLQRNDPNAFKALLERNGIKYNPNFVRGRS